MSYSSAAATVDARDGATSGRQGAGRSLGLRFRTEFTTMTVLDWLLDSDPAVRWQVLRDLADAPADVVAAERARVATEGWGARLLALRGPDGQWAGGACFPAAWQPTEAPGQPWTSTLPTLVLLQDLGLDPQAAVARETAVLVRQNCRGEYDGRPFFEGEVEACING